VLDQECLCPSQIGGWATWSRKGVSPRMVVEHPSPWLNAGGFSDLREVRHPAAVGLISFGIEQSQDSDINAVVVAR